ncbi:hypothetical protein K502DRAFT_323497 [Neoconidiobolus thromboides FSU 785]|nr:hypothetical protein K502DRAFT_323497 [Neoconidiobolus thromboides FSU 785]
MSITIVKQTQMKIKVTKPYPKPNTKDSTTNTNTSTKQSESIPNDFNVESNTDNVPTTSISDEDDRKLRDIEIVKLIAVATDINSTPIQYMNTEHKLIKYYLEDNFPINGDTVSATKNLDKYIEWAINPSKSSSSIYSLVDKVYNKSLGSIKKENAFVIPKKLDSIEVIEGLPAKYHTMFPFNITEDDLKDNTKDIETVGDQDDDDLNIKTQYEIPSTGISFINKSLAHNYDIEKDEFTADESELMEDSEFELENNDVSAHFENVQEETPQELTEIVISETVPPTQVQAGDVNGLSGDKVNEKENQPTDQTNDEVNDAQAPSYGYDYTGPYPPPSNNYGYTGPYPPPPTNYGYSGPYPPPSPHTYGYSVPPPPQQFGYNAPLPPYTYPYYAPPPSEYNNYPHPGYAADPNSYQPVYYNGYPSHHGHGYTIPQPTSAKIEIRHPSTRNKKSTSPKDDSSSNDKEVKETKGSEWTNSECETNKANSKVNESNGTGINNEIPQTTNKRSQSNNNYKPKVEAYDPNVERGYPQSYSNSPNGQTWNGGQNNGYSNYNGNNYRNNYKGGYKKNYRKNPNTPNGIEDGN